MALSFNPMDLFKVWQDHRKDTRDSFIGWIDAVQKELKQFLALWIDIRDELAMESSGHVPFSGWTSEKSYLIAKKFSQQSILATYMKTFYEYASAAAGGRKGTAGIQALSAQLSTVLVERSRAREVAEWYADYWGKDRQYFYASDENAGKWGVTVQDAIDNLTREVIELDVLIETIKANP